MTTHGTVRWFDDAKGFGYIEVGPGRQEIRVDSSAIQATKPGRRSLQVGQRVKFGIGNGDKGLCATDVRPDSEPVSEQHAESARQRTPHSNHTAS
ncbi:cold shock domain-containing protein [Nocardia sp. NPDC050710]|uniref:cold-shock protein n=1 Tax=Nocardia sp. NPDC050710 TaxID=3157220 RepID=UPI0033F645AE